MKLNKKITQAQNTKPSTGATIGEAELCPMFQDMLIDAIAKAEGRCYE